MNIAILSRSTTKHFTSGGMEVHLKLLTEGLAALGHKVTVVTTSQIINGATSLETIEESINSVNYIYIGNTTPGLNPITLWESIFQKLGLLRRGEYGEGGKNFFIESRKVLSDLHQIDPFDIIISQSTVGKGVVDMGIPIISIIHGTIFTEIKNRFSSLKTLKNTIRLILVDLPKWLGEHYFSNRQFFGKVDGVVAVSRYIKDKFTNDYQEFNDKVHVIYNGVDSEKFSPANSMADVFTILNVGRMDREKGIDLIIQTVKQLKDDGKQVRAKLVGSGVHISELKELVSKLNLDDAIEFTGQVDNSDLPDIYRSATVFLLPTRREEGHPVTLSEAFCCGLPFIATKRGGLSELITDGTDGFFVTEDVDSIVEKIAILYDNPVALKSMSENARSTGVRKFSIGTMLKMYDNLISKIVHESK